MSPAFGARPTPGPGFQLSLDKTVDFRCTSSRFTNADERRRFCDGWPTHRSPPALYRVSVRSLTALRRCFLPTVGHPSAVAGLSYFVNRSHRWYTAFLKTFVLVQGTCTLLVNRHARRTKSVNRSWLGFRFVIVVSFVTIHRLSTSTPLVREPGYLSQLDGGMEH